MIEKLSTINMETQNNSGTTSILARALLGLSKNDLQEDKHPEFDLNINVWSADQESLEQQALNELTAFADETKLVQSKPKETKPTSTKKPESNAYSSIEKYIANQKELQKRQDYTRSLKNDQLSESCTTHRNKRKLVHKKISSEKKRPPNIEKSNIDESSKVRRKSEDGDSDYVPSGSEDVEETFKKPKKVKINVNCQEQTVTEKVIDDGFLESYQERLELHYKKLEMENKIRSSSDYVDDVRVSGSFKLPSKLWNNLYSYQQEGVKWLWTLNEKLTGGILGDEMGLGKTVQIIVFLYGLDYSRIFSAHQRFIGVGPCIIACPATVIHQWVRHFHHWAPEFRIGVLHQSGSYLGDKLKLIKEMHKSKGIIITTYQGILRYKNRLLDFDWHYIILDEGHQIRNHNAKATKAVKELRALNRLMLTGSPMQNNLQELWSLFDFTNPGMLGNLNSFMEHFANPIAQGGFANSTEIQEATAMSVAATLKTVISPYLLRRTKNEVKTLLELPKKNEQVLFCSLTEEQKCLYKDFLTSDEMSTILGRGSKYWMNDKGVKGGVLRSIMDLRKICNHPDAYLQDTKDSESEEMEENDEKVEYGFYKKSGKMIVVSALLKLWKKQNHRVLLFTQSRVMVKIFQKFLQQYNYKYLKMDGSTTIASRQLLIEKFNQDSTYDVFLLTTKVGGLGINLTGANRVIIYDPDWNPATDTQARERAWRIGQLKDVTIYRLLSAGTIEEKIYQRQVWKQLLSNKILLDPKIHRSFRSSDLLDLFSLDEKTDGNSDTANIFHNSRVKIQEKFLEKAKGKNKIETDTEKPETEEDENISKVKETKKPSAYQKQLEVERRIKLESKKNLKSLTAPELLEYNRLKANQKEDVNVNRVDGCDTACSFSEALDCAQTTSKKYNDIRKSKKHKKKRVVDENNQDDEKVYVDESGTIDGEKVDGLVKTEIKKVKREKEENKSEDYILSSLLFKRGISGALDHNSVVGSSVGVRSLKANVIASERAAKSLEALKKSRLEKWRW